MKCLTKLFTAAAFGTALMGGAVAQNFPDAPEYHWAYEALLNMKNEGILVGYPDGLFRGGRPANRYELAAAVNSAYEKLKGMISGLQNQVDTLNRKIGDVEGQLANKADKSELAALRDALSRLQADVETIKGWKRIIDDMQRLVNEFQVELREIRSDVDGMKSDLDDLKRRVTALEGRKPSVDIHGDVNLIMLAGHSIGGQFGLTVDRRPTGYGRGDYSGEPVGITRDLTFGHEAAFRFSSTSDSRTIWYGTLVAGNLVGFADGDNPAPAIFGNQSGVLVNHPFAEPSQSVYFQDLAVETNFKVLGRAASARFGRISHELGEYFFKRIDNTPYFRNDRWDNERWYFDGATLDIDAGFFTLNMFGGRQFTPSASGLGLQTPNWPMTVGIQDFGGAGNILVDQHLGAEINFKLGELGEYAFRYIFIHPSEGSAIDAGSDGSLPVNRVAIYGGEAKLGLGGQITIDGGFSKSEYQFDRRRIFGSRDEAWWAKVGINLKGLDIYGGYRNIGPLFGAPGSWGRVGHLWNPVDHKGVFGGLKIPATKGFGLNIEAYSFTPVTAMTVLGPTEYKGGVAEFYHQISRQCILTVGGEWVEYTVPAGVLAKVFWGRAGLTFDVDRNTVMLLNYEYSKNDANEALGGLLGILDRNGGLLSFQWGRKF